MMKRFQLFSFDVVESDAFKLERSAGDESPQWLESFQSFFDTIVHYIIFIFRTRRNSYNLQVTRPYLLRIDGILTAPS